MDKFSKLKNAFNSAMEKYEKTEIPNGYALGYIYISLMNIVKENRVGG